MGRLGRGLPLVLAVDVNFIVVVVVEFPGVTEGGVKVAVVFAGKFDAVNVTAFGKLVPVTGEIWIVTEIG